MAFTPWYTSSKIIDSVKRKIAIPIHQDTFSEQDILNFASEELMVSMLPKIMSFHEEYYVWSIDVPFVDGVSRYEIPDRAIGVRLRDMFLYNPNGGMSEMSRISPEDKIAFGAGNYDTGVCTRYYIENNQVVLLSDQIKASNGGLKMSFFIRPNILVPEDRACYIDCFLKTITLDNSNLVLGDILTIDSIDYVAGVDFAIGATSSDTATNLATVLLNSGLYQSVSSSLDVIELCYLNVNSNLSSNSLGIQVQQTLTIKMTSDIPSNIVNGALIDILQTKSGHRIRGFDVKLGFNSVSTNSITLNRSQVPNDTLVGDYIALASESIIPQIPTDMHPMFCEQICARILASMGDVQGLGVVNDKISRDDAMQSMLLDNRVEGSPQKVIARHSLLRYGKNRWNTRLR